MPVVETREELLRRYVYEYAAWNDYINGRVSSPVRMPHRRLIRYPANQFEGVVMPERNPDALTDDDRMPFGKHKGERLGDVPDSYLCWFLAQDWCDKWPRLVDYANLISDDER